MDRFITYENLEKFAYSNDKLCKSVKGIVLDFSGCSIYAMYSEHTPRGLFYAEKDVIYVIPYYNPWAWMNEPAVSLIDEIMDVLFAHYGLSEDTPIASTGGSMGGYGAIMYMIKAKRTPVICAANCPVCDVEWQVKNRFNNPRTFYSAFCYEQGSFEEVVKRVSPMNNVDKLPQEAEYHLFSGDNDQAVNYTVNSKRFYKKLQEAGLNATFMLCPGRDHAGVAHDSDEPMKKYILERFGIKYESCSCDRFIQGELIEPSGGKRG